MRALILVATAALALSACGDREDEIDRDSNIVVDENAVVVDCDNHPNRPACRHEEKRIPDETTA